MKSLLKPRTLKIGDRIGVIACSTPIVMSTEESIKRGYSYLKSLGFEVVEAQNCRKSIGHTAGTITERVEAIHNFFKDPAIDAIMNYWGGYQSHQLLEYLDFDLIRRHPKPFIGYSDTTALHLGLYTQAGLITFLGPAVITFAKPNVPEFTLDHFKKALIDPVSPLDISVASEFSDNKWYLEPEKKMHFKSNSGWRVFRNGASKGRIIAGNLGTMLLLAGTKYWPDLKGKILFVEDDEVETSKTIDRMFFQLRHMGVYDQIAGMIVGRFHSDVGFKQEDSLEMILEEALKGYDFPVITNVDFGHTDPLITIPIGIQCEMDTGTERITFLERGTEDGA